jgi:predicted N-acetyltransferase YhbS
MQIQIRSESPEDFRKVEELTRDAFWDVHVPGCNEHYLAHLLRGSACFIRELDLVATVDGDIVGNIMYTQAHIRSYDGTLHPVISFGPLSVLPTHQRQGVGKALIEHSSALARDLGYTLILIYGDPVYYSRFGFVAAEDFGICGSEGYYSPALQVYELVSGALKGITGHFIENAVYQMDDAAAALFDKSFPPRAKGFAPSQTRFQELLAMGYIDESKRPEQGSGAGPAS